MAFNPVPRRRRAAPKARKAKDSFGNDIAVVSPSKPRTFVNPNSVRIPRPNIPDLSFLPERNPALIIAKAALASRRAPLTRTDPFAVVPVIERHLKPAYNIEEEADEAKENLFFVEAFRNIDKDIAAIVSRFFGRHYNEGGNERTFFKNIIPLLTPTLRRYISFLADGDIGGLYDEDGWKTIFREGQEREYLFRGILHKFVEENVFDKLLFGTLESQERLFSTQETTYISRNGMLCFYSKSLFKIKK